MDDETARPNGKQQDVPGSQQGTAVQGQPHGDRPRGVTRQGLIDAIGLMMVHLPEHVLHLLWKLLAYPPAQLRRARLALLNCDESRDLFFDAIRVDRIVRYLDAKYEEGLLNDVENPEGKAEVRRAIEQFRGRIGLGITILRTQLGEVAQKYKISFRGLSHLGAYQKVYERSGQKLFERPESLATGDGKDREAR